MVTKSFIFLVCVVFTATFMMAATKVEAQLGLPTLPISPLLGSLTGILNIRGLVFCSGNGTFGTNGTSIPVFPNAVVQLRCGNEVLTTVRTNSLGVFSIVRDILDFPLSSLFESCNIVVTTPLASCNASLPSTGGLNSTGFRVFQTPLAGFLGNPPGITASIIGLPFEFITTVPNGFVFNSTIMATV